jgi:hypothetical protein
MGAPSVRVRVQKVTVVLYQGIWLGLPEIRRLFFRRVGTEAI